MAFTIDIGTAGYGITFMQKMPLWNGGVGVNATPTSPVSVDAPQFILDYKEDYLNCNYCYCPLFKRYYFIVDKVIDIGKTITLICKSDAVASFLPDHLNEIDVVTIKVTSANPTYFPDPQFPIDPARKEFKCLYFYEDNNNILGGDTNNYLLEVFSSTEAPYTPPADEDEKPTGGDS